MSDTKELIIDDSIITWYKERLEKVNSVFLSMTGEKSVCQIHKDGDVTESLKYHEGIIQYALSTVKGAVKDGVLDSEGLNWINEVFNTSQTFYDHYTKIKKQPGSVMWISYNKGVLDTL